MSWTSEQKGGFGTRYFVITIFNDLIIILTRMFTSDVEEDDSVTIDDVQTLRQVIYYYPNNKLFRIFLWNFLYLLGSFLLTICKNNSKEVEKLFSEFVSNLKGSPACILCVRGQPFFLSLLSVESNALMREFFSLFCRRHFTFMTVNYMKYIFRWHHL